MQKSKICYPSPPPSKLDTPSKHLPINEPLKGPDLVIYSQTLAWQMGERNPPGLSFDNPDIWTWVPKEGEPGVRLRNEVLVRFQNVGEVVAIGTVVHCYTSKYGIGIQKKYLDTKYVPSIPAGGEVVLFFSLSPEILEGEQRIGVHIELEHSNDKNPENNKGSQVADGIYTSTGIRSGTQRIIPLTFPVFNDSMFRRTINFTAFPSIVNDPPSLTLDPFEGEPKYSVGIKVPDTLHGSLDQLDELDMTLLAVSNDDELVGGLNVRLLADD
jgi:hypothetical protein